MLDDCDVIGGFVMLRVHSRVGILCKCWKLIPVLGMHAKCYGSSFQVSEIH